MRAGVLSAAWDLASIGRHSVPRERALPKVGASAPAIAWSTDTFAEEQIRGLVRQVFSPVLRPPVQQVILSALESETKIGALCLWMAQVLASEKGCEVGVVDETELHSTGCNLESGGLGRGRRRFTSLRQSATGIDKSVWAVPSRGGELAASNGPSLSQYLGELRREFECSIVAAEPATLSSQALEMARFADGIILVLSAQRTRRATALKIRKAMSQVRLLGTILSDREFPIPESIYRRL